MNREEFYFKISKDLLISLLITYFCLLIPELILPGIVSSHISPKFILVLIVILGWIYSWLGKNFPIPQDKIRFKAISRNLLHALLFVITIMLVLSLYKMKAWQIVIVTLFTVLLIIASQKFLLEEK